MSTILPKAPRWDHFKDVYDDDDDDDKEEISYTPLENISLMFNRVKI